MRSAPPAPPSPPSPPSPPRTGTPIPGRPRTSRWLAHHDADHLERCTVLAGRHVCRRCAVLYPVALAAAVVTAVALLAAPDGGTPSPAFVALMWLLPVPAALDWTAEHLGLAAWSPRRQVAVTVVAAPALGVAIGVHAVAPFAAAAVAPMAVWTLTLATVALVGARRRLGGGRDGGGPDGWLARHEALESQRRARVEALARQLR